MEPRATPQDQFAAAAEAYVASPLHAEGPDLAALIEWAAPIPGEQALDLATGGGHVALALASLGVEILATDLTPEMLSAAERHLRSRGFPNVRSLTLDGWWTQLLAAGFDVARMATFDKRHGLDEWMARMRTPKEARDEVCRRLRTADPGLRRAFALEYDGGEPIAYRDLKALFLAQVPR